MATRRFIAILSAALALVLSGCGGSSASPGQATLVSVAISPQSPTIALGKSQQFTTTGTYSDGSTQNLTSSAAWTSATLSVATISSTSGSQGLAASVGLGTSVITGTVGSLSSSTTLTVNPSAGQLTWTQAGPVARFSHSTVYDPTTTQMVIFGGQAPDSSTNLNDVWLASVTSSVTGGYEAFTYSALLPFGPPPSPRFGHVATYDQNSNRMTLFGGGQGAPGPCANDVWILDGANGQSGTPTWLATSPSGTLPGARAHHTGVYDPGSNTLTVFGGSDCGAGFFNDVWVLGNANGEGGTPVWTKLSPTGTPPAAREHSTAIYDSANNIMTIYGGDAGGAPFGDVWVLSNANGRGGTPVWSQLSPTGPPPTTRTGHSAVYDSVNNRMMVFAGSDSTGTTLADSWILTFANGLGGPPGWTQLTVDGTAPNVEFHSAVYDQALNFMYVFAGTSSGNKLQTGNHLFTLTGPNGLDATTSQWFISGPPVRYSHSAFFDPSNGGSLFVFGGQHAFNINFDDYERDSGVIASSNMAWTKPTPPSGPTARFGHTGLYDSASNRMMVFGGGVGDPASCVNDYWVMKQATSASPAWAQVTPTGTAPPARLRHTSVYDSATNSLIIFGGYDCTSTYFNDVWRLSNANDSSGTPAWTHVTPSGTAPTARESSSAVYDSATNSMIVFGGSAGSAVFGDLWLLSHANGSGGTPAWTNLTASGTGPAVRAGHSAVYDSQNSRMVIYGGLSGTDIFSDVWVLSNANGAGGTPTWTQLTPSTPGPARYYHSAVYDPVSNQMTIFGGAISTDPTSPDANVFWLSDANGLP